MGSVPKASDSLAAEPSSRDPPLDLSFLAKEYKAFTTFIRDNVCSHVKGTNFYNKFSSFVKPIAGENNYCTPKLNGTDRIGPIVGKHTAINFKDTRPKLTLEKNLPNQLTYLMHGLNLMMGTIIYNSRSFFMAKVAVL
jgi:hypothetical protein